MTFYAYVYTDPRDGRPFYVGKGQGRRARKHLVQPTNTGMAKRIADLRGQGLTPEIATYPCDSEAHALELERVLIAAYGRLCDGSGCLVNVLEAGDRSGGFAGRQHSEETKQRIGNAQRGRKRPPEVGAKISAANKGRPGPTAEQQLRMIEARRRPEVRAKLSAAGRRGAQARNRK